MVANNVVSLEVQATFEYFLQVFFKKRNYEQLVSMFHPKITGFGMASDEVGLDYSGSVTMFAREIVQFPNAFDYHISLIKVENIDDQNGFVMSLIDCETNNHDNEKTSIENLRISAFLQKFEGKWLIMHLHISQSNNEYEKSNESSNNDFATKNHLLEQIILERTKELTRALRDIEKAATTDNLTGLFNRYKFNDILAKQIENAKENNHVFSLIISDIDYFKRINDRYGHLAGDEVLKLVSDTLKANLRKDDVLTRWGGEEFVILLPNTRGSEALIVAEKLRVVLEQTVTNFDLPLTMSFGIAEYVKDDDADSLINKADMALYKAKRRGRNRAEI